MAINPITSTSAVNSCSILVKYMQFMTKLYYEHVFGYTDHANKLPKEKENVKSTYVELCNCCGILLSRVNKKMLLNLKGYSEIIAVTAPSISIKSKIFAFW